MTIPWAMTLTGIVFIFLAFLLGVASDSSRIAPHQERIYSRLGWMSVVAAVTCFIAAPWLAVLT